MKIFILSSFLMFAGPALLASDDLRVDNVHAFSHSAKSSVVIYYSGGDKLRYHAVDSADGVLTLDLPGVFSNFDFSSLSFAQANEVMQAPLDPDVSKGISVRFMLLPGVTYEIFDQGSGELTMLFESGPVPTAEAPLPVAAPNVSEPTGENLDRYALASDEAVFHEINGASGDTRLSKLMVYSQPFAGRLLLVAEGLEDFTYFNLEAPRRFVLDLKNVTHSLEQSELLLDSPLVTRIRVRQFKSQPQLVTRLVLDLKRDAAVDMLLLEDGLLLGYASDENRLAAMMDASREELASPSSAIAEHNPAPPATDTETADDSEISSEPNLPESEDLITEVVDIEDVALAQPEEAEGTNVEVANAIAEPMETAVENTPDATDLAAPSNLAVESDETPALAVDTVDVMEPFEDQGQVTAAADVDGIEANEPESISTEAEILKPEQDDLASVVEEDAVVSNETAFEESQDVMPEPEPAQTEPMSADPIISLPEPEPANQTSVARKAIEQATVTQDPIQETPETLTEPEPDVQAPVEGVTPKFTMASDLDVEMQEFLSQTEDKSFYGLMKGVKSNRKVSDSITVTNGTIEEDKRLREMRSMQEPSSTSEEDVSALFDEPIVEFGAVTIDAGEPQYRGFEIAIIDVKDADVVDLLRFIAEQVGINLYVDSSVKNLTATYAFRNIPWDQALDIILSNANLDKEFRNGVMRVATTEKFRQEEAARAALREQRELSVPLETVTFNLNYAKSADVMPLLSEYLSARGKILMDERTNMLIIQDIPKRMTTIRALIHRLDRMIAQVTIEARLVETTKRFLKELGIQWGLSAQYSPETGTETGVDFPNRLGVGGPVIGGTSPGGLAGGYAVNLPVVAENPSGLGLTLGNFLDNFKLDISLQMLESEGFGQIISSPKVTTQNNKTAIIKNGQEVPIQTIQRGTVTVRYIEAVLELEVTPHITADETVIMDVIVDKSEPDFTRTVNGNPVINIRRAETRVLVKNGGTAVIGGIFTLNEQGTDTGIPGLMKVPILKRLFSNELRSYENQELLIFITPRIVKY